MEAVKKKMNNLKEKLDEAERKASKAQDELNEANQRADEVNLSVLLFSCFSCFLSVIASENKHWPLIFWYEVIVML